MQNDPDDAAMEREPIQTLSDADEDLQTTVIEGGPSGGLFLPDHDPSSDEDVKEARRLAEQQLNDGADSDSYANDQLMKEVTSEEEEESDTPQDDEDDPIVQTHNIYATKKLAEHLYLFQYPIRPPDRQYVDLEKPTEARMKPRANMVEVDVPIPETAYYDQRRGRQWTDESLRKQTIAGRITPGRNYLVGVMDKGHLHVTPLKGIAQLRPNFQYIDSHDAEAKEVKRSENIADRAPRAAKAIQVSAKSSDAMPDLSTTSLLRAAEEENWTRLTWRDQYEDESATVSQWLVTKKTDVVCESVTDKAAYLDLLSTTGKEQVPVVKVKK